MEAMAARASEALTSDFCPLWLWLDDSKAGPRAQVRLSERLGGYGIEAIHVSVVSYVGHNT